MIGELKNTHLPEYDMKKLLLYTALFFITYFSVFAFDYDYFDEIKKSVKLKENEELVIIFQNIGFCKKCYLKPMDQVEKLRKEGSIDKFKLLALVRCERNKELKIYKRTYDWKNYLYRDDGNGREKLECSTDTYLVAFDYQGRKIVEKK